MRHHDVPDAGFFSSEHGILGCLCVGETVPCPPHRGELARPVPVANVLKKGMYRVNIFSTQKTALLPQVSSRDGPPEPKNCCFVRIFVKNPPHFVNFSCQCFKLKLQCTRLPFVGILPTRFLECGKGAEQKNTAKPPQGHAGRLCRVFCTIFLQNFSAEFFCRTFLQNPCSSPPPGEGGCVNQKKHSKPSPGGGGGFPQG